MFNSVFPIYSIFVTVNSLHKIAIKRYKMTNSIWLNASPKFMLLSTKCSDIVFTFGFAINLTGFRSRSVVVVFYFFSFFSFLQNRRLHSFICHIFTLFVVPECLAKEENAYRCQLNK